MAPFHYYVFNTGNDSPISFKIAQFSKGLVQEWLWGLSRVGLSRNGLFTSHAPKSERTFRMMTAISRQAKPSCGEGVEAQYSNGLLGGGDWTTTSRRGNTSTSWRKEEEGKTTRCWQNEGRGGELLKEEEEGGEGQGGRALRGKIARDSSA